MCLVASSYFGFGCTTKRIVFSSRFSEIDGGPLTASGTLPKALTSAWAAPRVLGEALAEICTLTPLPGKLERVFGRAAGGVQPASFRTTINDLAKPSLSSAIGEMPVEIPFHEPIITLGWMSTFWPANGFREAISSRRVSPLSNFSLGPIVRISFVETRPSVPD